MKNREKDSSDAPRGKRRIIIGVGITVVVLALVAVGCVWWGNRGGNTNTAATIRTVKVERTNLVSAFVIAGTLAYGEVHSLGGGGGVVTKVPEAGQEVRTGQVIMEVEGAPVFLLQGNLPLWREVGPGMTGPDVAMVRAGLAALGHAAGEAGKQSYDADLSAAIGALYASAGYQSVPLSGTQQQARTQAQTNLSAAQATLSDAQNALSNARNRKPSQAEQVAANNAVSEAQRRLDAANRGDCGGVPCTAADISSAAEALNLARAQRDDLNRAPDTTGEQAAVTAAQRAVAEAQAAYDQTNWNTVGPNTVLVVPESAIRIDNVQAKVGLAAENVLTWTQTILYGRVDLTAGQRQLLATGQAAIMKLPNGSEVAGTLGEITESRQDPQTYQTIPASARIDIDDQTALAELGTSAVTVSFVQDEAENTLVVPVTALMALAEGGYCVERPDGTLVAVEVGLIADTRAQISSPELSEGDEVVVP